MSFRTVQHFFSVFPVNNVFYRGKVIGAAILTIEVIGVLPDVDVENRSVFVKIGGILIMRYYYVKLSVIIENKPNIARPDEPQTRFDDLVPHFLF